MALYRLKKGVGSHDETVDGEVVTLMPGDTIESDTDMIKRFTNKFEFAETPNQTKVINIQQPNIPVPPIEAEVAAAPTPQPSADLGEDVTSSFKIAEQNNLTVFKKDDKHVVVKDSGIIAAALNEDQLNEFLKPLEAATDETPDAVVETD